jgi:hypothetical protein
MDGAREIAELTGRFDMRGTMYAKSGKDRQKGVAE